MATAATRVTRVAAVTLVVTVTAAALFGFVPPAAAASSTCLRPPVPGPIAVAYRQPACPYCSGHRGVEYHPPVGTPVTAVVGGVVTFSGLVAGVRYVVVAQGDGLLATYGFLQASALQRGVWVASGAVVGLSTGRLYFGWRRDGQPVDPTGAFAGAGPPPRLVPSNGARPRPAPSRACAVAAPGR